MNLNQGEIIIRDTPSQAAAAAADLFAKTARECVSDKGFFHPSDFRRLYAKANAQNAGRRALSLGSTME